MKLVHLLVLFPAVTLAVVLSLSSTSAPAPPEPSPVAREIADLLELGAVLMLGEVHQRPESQALVAEVVDAALAGGCLAVALEIPETQQMTLDAAMRGTPRSPPW